MKGDRELKKEMSLAENSNGLAFIELDVFKCNGYLLQQCLIITTTCIMLLSRYGCNIEFAAFN